MPLTEISVRVTGKNIKEAERFLKNCANRQTSRTVANEHCCPIALSLFDRGFVAYVTRKCAVVYRQADGEIVNVFRLPEVAQEFVRNFDEGNPVQPIEFTLERNMDEEA